MAKSKSAYSIPGKQGKFDTHIIVVWVDNEAGVLANQVIVWDRFQRHLIDAGFSINIGGKDRQCFATDSSGIGYDQEVFYETEEDISSRREKGLLKSFYSRIITQMATVIINVPVFKHNGITGLSGCLKNLAFGSVNNTSRFHSNPLNCDPAISEIFAHTVIKDKLVLIVVTSFGLPFLIFFFDRIFFSLTTPTENPAISNFPFA